MFNFLYWPLILMLVVILILANGFLIDCESANKSEMIDSQTNLDLGLRNPSVESVKNQSYSNSKLPYKLDCRQDSMIIELDLSSFNDPYVYLDGLRLMDICRPKISKSIAIFNLSLANDFHRCGTIKIHEQFTGSIVYYHRIIVESKRSDRMMKSIYFKCSRAKQNLRSTKFSSIDTEAVLDKQLRIKRNSWIDNSTGRLVNFTEIDFDENFVEAEILDFGENITARAPYPHLNLKVKQNNRFVNKSLNIAPGTPLEMIIYLDDESSKVFGLLANFMKVTDEFGKQQEVIVSNGCSIDPYIFGNFESEDGGDSISAKFRAFKFPESNYVMFVGTVNVCLDQCKKVPCGNGLFGLGRRRRRRDIGVDEKATDRNKVYEIEMMTYLKIGFTTEELANRRDSIQAIFDEKKF
ncbi:hypothetical protein SSS_04302 [Sarcoptes scabiei]|uniref:ZP domain-containing protein n=1 Tax=Sarcoptes scabiei TaxID=52283 RepID=A0A834R6N7_SARSC|nr:hypothetical protein SSS_04302 [Sarcoptes scabiei]